MEFVPGRDTLFSSAELARGADFVDERSGELFLLTAAVPAVRSMRRTRRAARQALLERGAARSPRPPALPQDAISGVAPFALRALRLFHEGRLPEQRDGRESAGPVDVVAFLQDPKVVEEVEAALGRRRARLAAQGGGLEGAEERATALSKVVHGASAMSLAASWQNL